MNTKWGLRGLFILIMLSIILVGGILVLYQSLPRFDIHNIDLTNVTEIKINDRGLLGNTKNKIEDSVTVQKFISLLKSSTKIRKSDVNLRINQGLCEVELIDINKNILASITVVKTLNEGIITSGQHRYRSESILSLIIDTLNH